MYSEKKFKGECLPDKCLCFTFDDGPGKSNQSLFGPATEKIGKFLFEENIRATFFVVGKHVLKYPEVIKTLNHYGHLIANHTFDHLSLSSLRSNPTELANQILRTDILINEWISSKYIYVRPPYGNWGNGDWVAKTLNKDLLASLDHLGPIGWDIDAQDWSVYRDNHDISDLSEKYFRLITDPLRNNGKQNGIVLMHDSSADSELIKDNNKCFELLIQLIPRLKKEGFKFVRLDEVESLVPDPKFTIKFALSEINNIENKFISEQKKNKRIILVNGTSISKCELLTAFNLGNGKIAIQFSSGSFLSSQDGGGSSVSADTSTIGDFETLEVIRISHGRMAFKTTNGHYLTKNISGKLMATATQVSNSEIFEFHPVY